MKGLRKIKHDLVPTGIPGLDDLFIGGIRSTNMVIVEGRPGTGKTTLGIQFIYSGARDYKENGLIVSFELAAQRILEDARSFGWELEGFKRKKGSVKIIHTNPSAFVQDLLSSNSRLIEDIRTLNVKRMFIDGLTSLKSFSESAHSPTARNTLYLVIQKLQELGITTMFTKELPPTMHQFFIQPDEQFLCDTIIQLSNVTNRRNVHRCLEIKKSRGQNFIQGQHTLRFESDVGLHVYRRTQSIPKELKPQPAHHQRLSTGIRSLDPILGGGVYKGSVTLVVGISGAGKTVMGLQFLLEGARQGQKGLLISLDEQPKQIIRNTKALGLGIESYIEDGRILLRCESPLELEMDVHYEHIVRLVEDRGIERVVVDSVITYQNADNVEAQQFIYALATYFKSKGITSYFHYESPELLGLSQISEDLKASAVMDNIVLLNYVEISTKIRRAITVPKSRGTNIPQKTREVVIEHGGMRVIDEKSESVEEVPQLPFSSYYGILSRAPVRQSPLIEGSIARGEELPESRPLN